MYASLAFNSTLKELKIDNWFIPHEFKRKSLDEVRKTFPTFSLLQESQENEKLRSKIEDLKSENEALKPKLVELEMREEERRKKEENEYFGGYLVELEKKIKLLAEKEKREDAHL